MDNAQEKSVNQLEALLRTQIASHESLLELMSRKRMAMQMANPAVMAECTLQEAQLVQVIGQCEKERLTHVADLTLLLDPDASEPLSLMDLAQKLPEPTRGRLLTLRLELRRRMERVRVESGVMAKASQSLVRHVQGLIQMIGTACTGVSTYNPQGGRHQAATAVSTFSATA